MQCVYYWTLLKPKRGRYTVYELTETIWHVKMTVTKSDGRVLQYELSPSQTVVGDKDLKLSALSPTYSTFRFNEYLLESEEGVTWNVHANKLGDLSEGMIGDLQINL